MRSLRNIYHGAKPLTREQTSEFIEYEAVPTIGTMQRLFLEVVGVTGRLWRKAKRLIGTFFLKERQK